VIRADRNAMVIKMVWKKFIVVHEFIHWDGTV